ncbi:MAG: 2,4-dihydroxyhept-2-ene-1,7-dioic acid aldolase [Gammaproteobacteria bacterium]|nr:2,4-dihydroxyhept-2-ene-1,7-dioic acid aldolase [Gammaproteobacteria bacterium]
MDNDSLKLKLRQNRLTIGSWITLAHPAIAEIMARSGFDWLAVDLEHSVITIREAEELIRVIALHRVAPLVRLTSNDVDQIKRVMDAGAHGVIVPMVNSRADAERAVAAVYYPPRGHRGVGLARAQGYGTAFADYRTWLEQEAVVIVQIEHIAAVQDLEAILSTPGVDGFIMGPYDLSASMNIPGQFDNPRLLDAIEQVRSKGLAMGKPGGLHVVEPCPDQLREHIARGFRFLAYSLDTRMLDVACRNGLAECRAAAPKSSGETHP